MFGNPPIFRFCPLKFKFVPLNYDTIVDIRDVKWFIYIRMPLYPSIFVAYGNRYFMPKLEHIILCQPFVGKWLNPVCNSFESSFANCQVDNRLQISNPHHCAWVQPMPQNSCLLIIYIFFPKNDLLFTICIFFYHPFAKFFTLINHLKK